MAKCSVCMRLFKITQLFVCRWCTGWVCQQCLVPHNKQHSKAESATRQGGRFTKGASGWLRKNR